MATETQNDPAQIAQKLGRAARALMGTRDFRVWAHNARERTALRRLAHLGLIQGEHSGAHKTELGRTVREALWATHGRPGKASL